MASNTSHSKGQEMLKKMVLKKLRDQGHGKDIEGLDDVEIPEEHEEILEGLTKLFKSADRSFLTLKDLMEFEHLLEKKGVVGEGGLMKKGGLLEDAGLLTRDQLTPEQYKQATKFSLDDHLRPAVEKLEAESTARRKAIAAGKLAKEKVKEKVKENDGGKASMPASSSTTKKVSASENRQRVVKEVKAKLKIKKDERGRRSESESTEKGEKGEEGGEKEAVTKADQKKVEAKEQPSTSSSGSSNINANKNEDSNGKNLKKNEDTNGKNLNKNADGNGKKLDKNADGNGKKLDKNANGNGKNLNKNADSNGKKLDKNAEDQKAASSTAIATTVPTPAASSTDMKTALAAKLGDTVGEKVARATATTLMDMLDLAVGSEIEVRFKGSKPGDVKVVRLRGEDLQPSARKSPEIEDDEEEKQSIASFRHLLYHSESTCNRPGPDGTGPPVVTYPITLHCLSKGTREEKVVELWTPPRTCRAIKERIQVEFQIPISFQHDLSFAGKPLEDTSTVASIGLKPGGRLTLHYLSEGQLEEVRVAMKWFEYVLKFAKNYRSNIFSGQPVEYGMVCYQGITELLPERLSNELFVPWDSDVTYANRIYFIQEGGIEHLLNVYERIIFESWRTLVLRMKLMEAGCIKVLAALGSSTLNRQKVLDSDGHGFVLQSLLRVLVRPRGSALLDNSGAPGPAQNNQFMLREVLAAAMDFFVNFRECSEIHIDICSKNNCVDQVISIAHCPSFSVKQAHGCMCLLACCMHSADTHKWLCRNHTLESIANCVKVHKDREADSAQITLLHYYAQVTLAHLVMTSIHAMSRKVMEKLVAFMEEFLTSTKPATIQELEASYHPYRGWAPFFPYLKILLSPPPYRHKPEGKVKVSESESHIIARLTSLSVETMLFVVQVMSTNDPYKARRQLLEEKLLPYALCLSANVPRRLLHSAKSVVTALRSNSSKPVPIPKLSIMSRAKLATVHFGLKKILDRTADELKLEVSPPPPRPTPARRERERDRGDFTPLVCVISM